MPAQRPVAFLGIYGTSSSIFGLFIYVQSCILGARSGLVRWLLCNESNMRRLRIATPSPPTPRITEDLPRRCMKASASTVPIFVRAEYNISLDLACTVAEE